MGGDHGSPPAAPASARPRVLLVCSPCIGHLIPFTELARRLVADHGLAATLLFAAATSPPSLQYLAVAASARAEGVDLVALPAADEDALPSTASLRDRVARAVAAGIPGVRDAARSLAPLAAVVADMVGAPARVVAEEHGVPFYTFFTSPWMLLSLFLHLPAIDDAAGGEEHRDATEPIRLPGCVPIHPHDLPGSMLVDRSSDTYAGFLAMAKDAANVDGILVNTFRELEPAIDDVADGVKMPPVHAVGPLAWTRAVSMDRDHGCLSWLDQQPRGSVVYVSFGSGGTLTWQQTAELALGLELSHHRFIWAIKRPDQDTSCGTFFGTNHHGKDDDEIEFLPKGFIKRIRGMGLVLQSWAAQTVILGHKSIGCFMTHCGWNSILESVSNGVPMVAWPLYAEQKMNAAMMEIQAKVAVRINVGPERVIGKDEIAGVIKRVMEGEEAKRMRNRVREMKDKAMYALSKDGCSTSALAQVTHVWISTAGQK